MLYVIMATLRPGVAVDDVQRALRGSVNSWYRIASNIWIVSSEHDADALYQLVDPLVRPSGRLFVSRLDTSDSQGLMIPTFWTWLQRHNP